MDDFVSNLDKLENLTPFEIAPRNVVMVEQCADLLAQCLLIEPRNLREEYCASRFVETFLRRDDLFERLAHSSIRRFRNDSTFSGRKLALNDGFDRRHGGQKAYLVERRVRLCPTERRPKHLRQRPLRL